MVKIKNIKSIQETEKMGNKVFIIRLKNEEGQEFDALDTLRNNQWAVLGKHLESNPFSTIFEIIPNENLEVRIIGEDKEYTSKNNKLLSCDISLRTKKIICTEQ